MLIRDLAGTGMLAGLSPPLEHPQDKRDKGGYIQTTLSAKRTFILRQFLHRNKTKQAKEQGG